jgi:hypothetical protein
VNDDNARRRVRQWNREIDQQERAEGRDEDRFGRTVVWTLLWVMWLICLVALLNWVSWHH